jgi:hypothetical protein
LAESKDVNDHPELKAQVAVNIMKLRRHNRLMQYRMKLAKDEALKVRSWAHVRAHTRSGTTISGRTISHATEQFE